MLKIESKTDDASISIASEYVENMPVVLGWIEKHQSENVAVYVKEIISRAMKWYSLLKITKCTSLIWKRKTMNRSGISCKKTIEMVGSSGTWSNCCFAERADGEWLMSEREDASLRRAVDTSDQVPRKTSNDPAVPARPGAIASAAAAVDAFLAAGEETPGAGDQRPGSPATRMFAAWSEQDAARVGRDPKVLLEGLRVVGADVREILRDAVSGDSARHARAEARLAELKRLQAEAGLAGDAPPEPVDPDGGHSPDSPEARFRGRLQTILEDAVGRLESLKAKVEADRGATPGAGDGKAQGRRLPDQSC